MSNKNKKNNNDKKINEEIVDINAETEAKAEKKEEKASPKKASGSGKGKRLKRGALSVVFTVIFVAAVVLVNIIFNMVSDRFDFSADLSDNSLYTIDSTTAEYLKGVEGGISIIVAADETAFENAALSTGQQYGKQVSEIIKSFMGANSNIDCQYKDLDSNPAFYQKYGATLQSGNIIVESEKTGRNVIITANDYLAPEYMVNGEKVDASTYTAYYQMGAGQYMQMSIEYHAAAERSLLSAIMNVTNENPVNVAVVTEDYGTTAPEALVELLEANAYVVETLKLTTVESIDAKYDYVVIHSPIYDFSNDDIDKLDRWLDNGGKYGKNLLYAAASNAEALPKLNSYLKEWGLSIDSGYVYQNNPDYKYERRPTLQSLSLNETDYSEGVDTATLSTWGDGLHPITLLFEEQTNYATQAIVSSFDGAVIAPYDGLQDFDPSTAEKTGTFVVAAESSKVRFEGTDGYYSRVFAIGGHYMLDATFMQSEQYNNSDIVLNMFNKTSGREALEVSVTPKSYTVPTFEISAAQAHGITIVFAVALPLVVVIFGIVVIVRRKRR